MTTEWIGRRRAAVMAAATMLAVLAPAEAGRGGPTGQFGGWGSDGQLTAQFAGGVALWEAPKRYAHVGLLPSMPSAEERAGYLRLTWWPSSVTVPAMSLGFKFKEGAHTASLAALAQYYVAFYNYPRNPYSTPNTINYLSDKWDASSGIRELSGDLRKGGRLRGTLVREWLYERAQKGLRVQYRWNLEFDAPLD